MSTDDNTLNNIWQKALKLIKSNIPAASFSAWVKPAKLASIDSNDAVLQVRNEFNRNLIVQNYFQHIQTALQQIQDNNSLRLTVEINADLPAEAYMPVFSSISGSTTASPDNTSQQNPVIQHTNKKYTSYLNPKFTFETFVVGTHNQFCHAAALSISQKPNPSPYNPFFIYGGVGLGKTHLMHAVGNYILKQDSSLKVVYITTEKFLNDLIDSMRKGKMDEFRDRYRKADVLLVDDIQFIEGKESTQQEFFHTFNALRDKGSQIIMTSDRPPSAMKKLEPRLCSRFEGGLIADIQPPTFETRLAIIERKAEELKISISSEVARRIAESFPENIRSLEGALVKLSAYTNLSTNKLEMGMVEKLLNLKQAEENRMSKIVNSVAYHLELDKSDITGPNRQKKLIHARQLCVEIARTFNTSWSEIGTGLGGRGNSSLISLHRNIKDSLKNNDFPYVDVLDKLKEQFQN